MKKSVEVSILTSCLRSVLLNNEHQVKEIRQARQ